MSHELRSPLGAVIGFSDLLLRDTKDELTNQLAPKIRDSGKYLLAMIEEMLDLDRIEAGKVSLKLEPASINDLVSGVVNSWHSRLPENFSMSLELDPDCGVIDCDETRISQILNNFVDNAIKYSPGGGAISVRTRATSDEVCVSVSDEGMGIEPEAKEVIFDRFHQLESGYKRRAGGLGIGLALARELIEMHGGRIWVDSEGEKGSTFSIALPQNQMTAQKASGQDGDPEELADNGNPWDGRKILIVDDIEMFHDYIIILMNSASGTFSAYNGLEAIEAARRENLDLILMDLRMPVLDGFEAIERLKSDPATRDIPIIAVTAQAMEEDRARSAQAGANGYVTKPINIETFRKEMGRVLGVRV
jgi:CheY-like chemotaxis protein